MYNRVILMGRLTKDPDMRQTQSGIAMCRITVAVDRPAKQGEEKKTDFIDVTCWRNTAEFVNRYFCKGKMIHVEGTLRDNNYTDQNGVKHYGKVVVADNVAFCGDSSNQQNNGYQNQQYQQNPYQNQYQQPQQYQQPMYAAPAPPPVSGDMSDYEEVLSDGDVPF